MPNDPLFLQLSEEELGFMAYWHRKVETNQLDALAELLGVRFHRSDFQGKKNSNVPRDTVTIPLSYLMGVNDVQKLVTDLFKKIPPLNGPHPTTPQGAINMGDLDLDEYFQLRKDLGIPVQMPEGKSPLSSKGHAEGPPASGPSARPGPEPPAPVEDSAPSDLLNMLVGRGD